MQDEHQRVTRSTEVLYSFAGVHNNMMRLIQRSAVENGLSVPQYSILMALFSRNEMTQKKVGEKTFLPKSTLSQAVDGLVREGLLRRKQVEGNRREVLLSLSEKGMTRIRTLHLQEGGIHQAVQSVLESMTEQQVDDLLRTHKQITDLLEKRETEEQKK